MTGGGFSPSAFPVQETGGIIRLVLQRREERQRVCLSVRAIDQRLVHAETCVGVGLRSPVTPNGISGLENGWRDERCVVCV